jgi:hypothetical protein
VYAYLHDAYHPEPAQPGEGRPGTGLLFRFTDAAPVKATHRLHVIVADEATELPGWTLTSGLSSWTVRNATQAFTLSLSNSKTLQLHLQTPEGHWLIEEEAGSLTYALTARAG